MASLSAYATQDDVEDELEFQDVLISSLDPGDENYFERLAELEAKRGELEARLSAMQQSRDQNQSGGPVGMAVAVRTGWDGRHN